MAIPEEHILKVMQLLVTWNPLGSRAHDIEDLNDYRTEAIDILFNVSLRGPNVSSAQIVQYILNEAFDLTLSLEDCLDIGREISQLTSSS
jgi:hypothetical protein